MSTDDSIPYGYCHCGCGEQTRIATRSQAAIGHVKGEPLRYILGHNARHRPEQYTVDNNGCWIWGRFTLPNGYGQLTVKGKRTLAHRYMYEKHVGPIPDGLVIDHLCRVRNCVNPDHLEPVTHTENQRRGRGYKLDPDEVREIYASRRTANAREIASRYCVSLSAIYFIWQGRAHREVTGA